MLEKFVKCWRTLAQKNLTPRKMTELTAKNLGEPCRPPDEVNGV